MPDVFEHLRSLSDPIRARLLGILSVEEVTVGELAKVLQLPQSTISRHVKTLDQSGWIERRAVGASSHLRLAEPLPDSAHTLWSALCEPLTASPTHTEDLARLAAVIRARVDDGSSYFGRINARWDDVRRDLFGDGLLITVLGALIAGDLVVGDLGCGTGDTVAALAPYVQRVIGVDREPLMLDVARARVAATDNVTLRVGGLSALPISDGTLDVALCTLVLHHIASVPAAMSEIRRTLRPGGRALVLDMRAHQRTTYRRTMGHVHLGFSRTAIAEAAALAGLVVSDWRDLPPSPGAQGPPLFLATLSRSPAIDGP